MSEGNLSSWLGEGRGLGAGRGLGMGLGRGRAPSFEALKGAVADLYRLDDFEMTTLGAGFFSDVYKVRHTRHTSVVVLVVTNLIFRLQVKWKLDAIHLTSVYSLGISLTD